MATFTDAAATGARARWLALARAHGRDAVTLQGDRPETSIWLDASATAGAAYIDTGGAWVAAGAPVTADGDTDAAARHFVDAARLAGRRACLVCTESLPVGFSGIRLGEQPIIEPAAWLDEARRHRSFKEQLRRARKKGIVVREVAPEGLAPGTPLRAQVAELVDLWLLTRHMAPLTFVAGADPFYAVELRRWLIAEKDGKVYAALSALPVAATRGWLIEQIVRGPDVPNGTVESMLHAFVAASPDAQTITLGLTLFSGDAPRWQRLFRVLARPLYNFNGLRAFRERMRPTRWVPVWLAVPKERVRARSLADALVTFSGGAPLRFLARSVAGRPSGPAWLAALPLVTWTMLLAVLGMLGESGRLAMSTLMLGFWVIFDALFAYGLVRVALTPRVRTLALATACSAVDAVWSVAHFGEHGLGDGLATRCLRGFATVGPIVGTVALGWATTRARALRQRLSKRSSISGEAAPALVPRSPPGVEPPDSPKA